MQHSERMKPELDSQHGYNEMAGGQYFASGKYYRYSVTEMDGTSNPVYEMPGNEADELAMPPVWEKERRPIVPPI